MAVVKRMNFKRGRLGDIGFRQQFVGNGDGTYSRQTVAFQIPDVVTNPRSPGQVKQRSKFRLVQALASALSSKSLLANFYRSGAGLAGYNAFIRDNINFATVELESGLAYVDFRKLQVTLGDFNKPVKAYNSALEAPDDCSCTMDAWLGFRLDL